MKSYIYKRVNGEEVQFRLTVERILDIEQRTGKSLPELYRDVDKLGTLLEILTCAMVGGAYEERKSMANLLYEEAIENEKTILELQGIIIEIYKNSGFLTPRQAELQKKMIALQSSLMGAISEDTVATQN